MLNSSKLILSKAQFSSVTVEGIEYKESSLECSYAEVKYVDNQAVFTEWMTEHEKLLRHIITGFEAKPAIQDELFQEIALNIWRALPKFRQDAAVKTFVARIAHNVLATHVAKAVKTVKTSDIERCAEVENIATTQKTPYQSLNQSQRQQKLANAIRQLKLEQQQVITLALEGMSYQEIADILVITTNLVGVRLQRAKTLLAQLLEGSERG
ncbi:RNA polymerase sigma factor [Colwellia sp. TT2012]|uniref:RNA polymerase sigma factor n=1 Tax=Colwellia sp. TT2012 TaxID=1720342 RepID=UPI0009E6ED9C|nr:sigma-70 family RNA polymerase sigma factor [Colwellia sp. TT2012]